MKGENTVLDVKNKSHTITAQIEVPQPPAEGVIVAQGGTTGGWTLFTKGGKLKYCFNLLGIESWTVESKSSLPAGQHQVRMEFAYDGGGLGKGGVVSLYVDKKKIGDGRVEQTIPFQYSFDETLDIGMETGSPVSSEYGSQGNAFNGKIKWVKLDIGNDSHDHLIDPDHAIHVAMLKQ